MDKRITLIPLIALTLGGCSLPFVGNKSVVQQVAQKAEDVVAAETFLKTCSYDQAVCKYFASMMTAYSKPMTMVSTSDAKEMGKSVSTVKMDGKGNMETTSTRDGKEESAMITLDKVTYFKDLKDNSWYKMSNQPTAPNDKSVFNPTSMLEDFKKQAEESASKMKITKLGEEACGSLTCLKYQMDEDEFNTKTVVWFDTKEYKARKMETVLDDMTTSTEYTYEAVSIAAPSPVKEMPDFAGEMEKNGIKMPSSEEVQKMMKDLPQGGGVDSGDNGDE